MATKAEQAVTNYLTATHHPDTLRDQATIDALEENLASNDDPIARLQLRQQINDAKHISPAAFEDDFVTYAKAWAEKNGVTPQAFLAEGVDPAVLRRAGFAVGRTTKPRTARARRQRVSRDDLRAAIPKRKGKTFTMRDIQDASGASPATVRSLIKAELEAGNLTEVGPDPEHQGVGRAPTLYAKA